MGFEEIDETRQLQARRALLQLKDVPAENHKGAITIQSQ